MSVHKNYIEVFHALRKNLARSYKRYLSTRKFPHFYVRFALLTLLTTTIFWSYVGAQIHMGNADQLVNPYMFDSAAVFRNATFPGQHTFFLKWPFFWLVHAFGNSSGAYVVFSIILSILSVGAFAYALYRIEKRPYIYATLLLALSSVLLMIPSQAAPGMLLPVNMGMIANRNIEYIVLLFGLFFILRAKKIHSHDFYIGTLAIAILLMSDKLFLSSTFLGSVIGMGAAILYKKSYLAIKTTRLLLSSVIAAGISTLILSAVNALHITHISQQNSTTYGFVSSLQTAILHTFYALSSILTNLGANPSIKTTVISEMPREALQTFLSLSGPIIFMNILIFIFTLYASAHVIFKFLKNKKTSYTSAISIFIVLACISCATLAAFIFTDHYAAGDARYLSIFLFTLFIGTSIYVREKTYSREKTVLFGIILSFTIVLSVPSVMAASRLSKQALSEIEKRNGLIADALANHPVNVLVGDYWRVLPIRQSSGSKVSVMPLSDCVTARDVLSSLSWQPNLQRTSFAYILSSDKSATDFPSCTLDDITEAYGLPNASIIIAGTQDIPTEQLLFFDHGAHRSSPQLGSDMTATSPLSLSELPNTTCSKPTRMTIVAHEDDDLLFMNPGLQTEISEGKCIRTIYLTAGDAGASQFYWLSREQGSEAAYNHMIGTDALWIHRTVKLNDKQYITVANPRGNSRVSLVYFRLPDGNLQGSGFGGYNHESIQKLYDGSINTIRSIYDNSSFTKDSLVSALSILMTLYSPSEIHTQSTVNTPPLYDHSDHASTARIADAAFSQYMSSITPNATSATLRHYAGYSVRMFPENVSGEELQRKTETFLRYAEHDSGVCHSLEECSRTPTYNDYLKRQYTTD